MGDPLVAIRMKYAEDIEDILQCPVCWEQPSGPIMTCVTGHHVCERCSRNIRKCPTCENSFSGSRNYLGEALSQSFEEIKTSILDPSHHINRRTLRNRRSVYTQTILEVESVEIQTVCDNASEYTQTDFSEVITTDTQTDFDGVSIETQTDNQELQVDSNGITTVPCFIKSCKGMSPYHEIISHIKRCHRRNLRKMNTSCKDFYSTAWTFSYEINTSYDYAINIHDFGLFLLNILIDEEGNLKGNLEVVSNNYDQQFYYNIFFPNEKKPLQSEFFKGVIHKYYEIGNVDYENIFISNSSFSQGLLKKKKLFDCSLSIHCSEA